jgi:hypothetical protein
VRGFIPQQDAADKFNGHLSNFAVLHRGMNELAILWLIPTGAS